MVRIISLDKQKLLGVFKLNLHILSCFVKGSFFIIL
jgi:hypothetical protein